jgi:signal transduction histidine kinase/CheY-like chemotaxis protein
MQREWMTPDGRAMLSVKFPLFGTTGEVDAIGTISTDITAQKQSETQLAHAQRMEAVGQLTGGVAHDFNNLLTAILLNADVLARQIESDSLRYLAEGMRLAAERGADLTRRLLAFGRRQVLLPQATDVAELLDGMETLMRRTLGEHIEIVVRSEADLWPAFVDPGQLESAIINLAVNARDAMTAGGRLTIETTNVELDESYAASHADVKPGQYVKLSVSDTGTGMATDVIERAFEPFFTTKDIGKGTGLGLSMVYGFVKQSEGHVHIHSEAGFGTVVSLYLPRSSAAASTAAQFEQLPQMASGSETILLVEDDPLVRAYSEEQLCTLGYDVVTAENAPGALRLVEQGYVPDLLFSDIVMPGGMSGLDLARHLRARWPGLKVLLTSGYAHGAVEEAANDPLLERYILAKPYRPGLLAARIREVLDEEPLAAVS